ncbi:hypothetical protein [Gordonia malaquae]|uniref:hypothetical protein n=1 Tax=Gordonia malaquae TaxID=410332 RepID=UPI003019A1AA
MTPTKVNVPAATSALDAGRRQVDELGGRVTDKQNAREPGVRNVLDALATRTRRELDGAGVTQDKTRTGVDKIVAADRAGATRVQSVPGDLASALTGRTGSGPTTVAPMVQQMAQQQAMAQQAAQMAQMAQRAAMMPMMAAAPMMQQASTAPQYPQGTVFLSAQQMAQLADALGTPEGRSNALSAVKQAWNGSTKPEPISVNQVAYEKTHGKLSEAQIDAAIEGAMDKTGIEPEARPKWKAVLKYMSHHESGGDANAVNLTDSNAIGPTQVDGAPAQSSRGPMQTIPTTFAAYHAAGTSNNIYDPEASFGAGINHMIANRGARKDGGGLDEFMAQRAGGYIGY